MRNRVWKRSYSCVHQSRSKYRSPVWRITLLSQFVPGAGSGCCPQKGFRIHIGEPEGNTSGIRAMDGQVRATSSATTCRILCLKEVSENFSA